MKNKLIISLLALLTITNIHVIPSTYIGELKPRGLYITYDTGIVLNENGDGLLTTKYVDDYYNYIKYDSSHVKTGDKVTTICVYNPFTIWGDDIIARFDFQKGGTQWKHF